MKKKILYLTAIVMSLLFCGCSADEIQNSIIEKASEVQENAQSELIEKVEESTKDFAMGTTEDGVYKSDFSGLKFTAPADWIFMSQEEIYELMGYSMDVVGENYSEFQKEIALKASITDMMCQDLTTGENVIIMYENISFYNNVNVKKFTSEDYIDLLNENMKNVAEVNITELNRENITLGGMDFLKVTYSNEIPSAEYTTTQIYYVAKMDNYMMSIILSQGIAEESVDQYESCFSVN